MEIRSPQTPLEWELYYDLRYRVLRQPWNQLKGSERDEYEAEAMHFAVFQDLVIIAVGRLDVLSDSVGKVRYMAVEEVFQGKNIGKVLMEFILMHCEQEHLNTIILHARERAVPFYERLGFRMVEKSHLLFGEIQHYLMEKKQG
jgi:GNAT superfamily N-acetyltransferase